MLPVRLCLGASRPEMGLNLRPFLRTCAFLLVVLLALRRNLPNDFRYRLPGNWDLRHSRILQATDLAKKTVNRRPGETNARTIHSNLRRGAAELFPRLLVVLLVKIFGEIEGASRSDLHS